MECNIKLNPKPTDGINDKNGPEYKNDQSLSKHSSIVDMTINQSYNESTCTSVQSYNDKYLTIQIDSFENADTI